MSVRAYIIVFAVLIGVTAGELGLISLQNISRDFIVTTLIGLAVVKAVLVVVFFQEVKDEPRPLSIMLIVGVVIVMALLSVSFLQLHPIHV
jgi:caa(3)-type oxidase subunit IV